jgi:hypothetical protein
LPEEICCDEERKVVIVYAINKLGETIRMRTCPASEGKLQRLYDALSS